MGAGTAWRRFVFFAVLCGWWTDRHSMSKKKSYLQVLTLNSMSLGIVFIVALKLSWTPCPNQGSSDFGFQSQSGSI